MGAPTSKPRTSRLLSTLIVWLGAGVPLLALVGLGAGILGAVIGGYLAFCRDLPDIPDLRAYRPKTVTTFYAEDGTVIGLFYTEKRFPIPLDTIPDHVVHAFLAAEDARFFSHPGVDLIGVIRAVVTNIKTANFAQGASTITQQVTRNFLLSKEKKFKRKIREAILAFRLEKTLTKREILQLYVNEIYFGKGAYGIEAAARTYFGKTTAELSIAEAALLAGVVASPSKFAPHRNLEGSLHRRDLVLDSMLRNAFISEDQRRFAAEETPSFRENLPNTYQRAPHFVEAVRQYIASQYGEDRVYNDGLQVWTTCDLALDNLASQALLKGAKAWEARQQRPPGLVKRLKPAEARMFVEGPDSEAYEPGDIVETLVLSNDTPKKRDKKKKTEDHFQECTLALAGGAKFQMRLESKVPFRPNDLLQFRVVKTEGTRITLEPEILPPVEGAVVCIENNTGYVRALVGGLDFERSRFNRASQAVRQPGSAFKPFVYTAALEYGLYGPHSIVVDEPIAVIISAHEPEWVPMNSDGSFLGPITLRQALAQSRNVAAVKLIMDVGVEPTIEMARAMGIESRLGKNLSLSLGASEVTPLELTSAYTVFPNMGVRVAPVLVKKVVDRFGKVLEDNTMEPLDISKVADQPPRTFAAPDPAIEEGDDDQQPSSQQDLEAGHPREPVAVQDSSPASPLEFLLSGTFPSRAVWKRTPPQKVMSPQTAYLMLSMLRETCVSGTGASASRLRRQDIAGKTGTTDECTDAWFVGFNPKYTTGVWIGYDAKVSLGKKEYGGTAALPVWMDFMKEALKNTPVAGYVIPPGIVFWGLDAPPHQVRVQDLLQAGPDFPPVPQIKPICPVDAEAFPVSFGVDPFTGWPIPASGLLYPMLGQAMMPSFFSYGYPGTVRILSPKGETIGQGNLVTDEKGRTTLWWDAAGQYGATRHQMLRQGFQPHSIYAGSGAFETHDAGGSPLPGPFPSGPGLFPYNPVPGPQQMYQEEQN